MKRPCFALLVLLAGLFAPLTASRMACGQYPLRDRVGCIRYDLCPLLDDDFPNRAWGELDFQDAAPRVTPQQISQDAIADAGEPVPVEPNAAVGSAVIAPPSRVARPGLWNRLIRDAMRRLPWTSWGELRCQWAGAAATGRARLRQSTVRAFLVEQYREWDACGAPTSVVEGEPIEIPSPAQVAQWTRDLGRSSLLELAESLDRTGRMLQNASRQLTHLVDNRSVESHVTTPIQD
ncbi:MAG: hypothetical protein FJ297_14480 [Planctomycetes bacterium]|nr:hypothetical protein [Planctomycetota bacterium]